MQIQFEDITLNVRPHQVHEWALTTAEVATGYGVSVEAIRSHKLRNADELLEGKHFVSVANSNAVGGQAETWWTKRGVVRLGFFIRSEQAKRFRDWAEDLIVKASEILPSYQIADPIERAQRWIEEQKQVMALQAEVEVLKPKAAYVDQVLSSETELTTTVIAKELGMSAVKLNKVLHAIGIQYKQRGTWILYSVHESKDYAHLRTHFYTDSEGKPKTKHYLVWTEKGRQFIHSKLHPRFRTCDPVYPGLPGIA